MEWVLGALGGLLGGNAAGAGKNSLGVGGNSVTGALGGLLGGGLAGNLLGGGGDISHIIGQLGGGGVVGAILTAVVGAVMKGRKS
ncbi:MAG: hypothetical protein ACKOQ4_09285 [Mycobacterium sp.]